MPGVKWNLKGIIVVMKMFWSTVDSGSCHIGGDRSRLISLNCVKRSLIVQMNRHYLIKGSSVFLKDQIKMPM